MTSVFQDKRIVLGVTGSIAIYKAVDLASKLTQAGALVDVIMTESAMRFVTPLAFQAVTGRGVYTSLWQSASGDALPTHIAHVGLGEGADLFAIIPATANTLAKLAGGLADDLLSVTALAIRCPLVIAPVMDGGMYAHQATQANVHTLIERGAHLIEPEYGRFASGLEGRGRMPEVPVLMGALRRILALKGPLRGRRVIVTAGGTREAVDPVRFISNHSSGKQGYAVAQAALDAGASVTLISTVDSLPVPAGAQLIAVDSAQQMRDAVLSHAAAADVLVMAAAVADFRPSTIASQKIKKQDDTEGLTLELVRNPDILLDVRALREREKRPHVVVAFAAESENLLENASAKLKRKGADLLVANDITADDAGFAVDTNRVLILDAEDGQESLPLMSKSNVAERLIERVAALLTQG